MTATPARRAAPWEALPALLLLAVGGLLLGRGNGLWFDELFTAVVAPLPLSEIARAAIEGRGTTTYLEGIPPSYNAPYYLVAHVWTALPLTGSDTSLRLLSLLAATGGVSATVRALSRLGGTPFAVVAGAAIGLNPLVLDQVTQARPYGLVLLATGFAALGLARWLESARGGLVLLGVAGAGMGLAHWYAVLALAGLVVAGLVLRPRQWLPLLAVAALAVAPTTALVVMNLVNGTGDSNAGHLIDTGGTLAWQALRAWSGYEVPLLLVTAVLTLAGLARSPRLRVVGAAWVGAPLLALTAAELVRPLYFPRYLLPSLLGLAVVSAAGAVASRWPRPVAVGAATALLATSALTSAGQVDRAPRERADDVVRALAEAQRPGEPVVAADHRAAIGLDHYVPALAPRLGADLALPPDDAPDGADRVWLVRNVHRGVVYPTDDDALLRADGLHLARETTYAGTTTTLVVQRWDR